MNPFILDQDFSNDPGDVGCLAVACAYHRLGHGQIVGLVVDTSNAYTPGAMDALATYLGVPGLPIGAIKRTLDPLTSDFPKVLYDNFPHTVGLTATVPNAVTVYRQLLAARTTRDLTIVSVGLLSNLNDLLRSPADTVSPLAGPDLIAAKCEQLIVMGAGFLGTPPAGHEWNIYQDPADASYVAANWPTSVPVVWAGHEVGNTVLNTTPTALPADHPIKMAYANSGYTAGSRPAWDEMAVMVACEGYGDYDMVRGLNVINATNGNNTFTVDPAGPHWYLYKRRSDAYYGARISDLTASPTPVAWSTAALVGLRTSD